MFRAIAHWFLTHGLMFMFAAGGAALPGGGGGTGSGSSGGDGTGGSPSPATGAPGGSPTPSSATGTPTQTSTPGQGQGSVDWATAPAHFRTAYEAQQAELARWKGLGVDHTAAQSYVQTAQGMVNESYQIGRQLGYSDQDIREALQDDVVNTLTFLRRAAVQANGQGRGQNGQGQSRQGQPDPAIQRLLDQRLRPIEEHTNAALADAANSAFQGEFQRLFTDHYKADAANIPKEVRDLLFDATSEMFKYEDKALHALKFGRDVSGIAKTFREVEQRVMQAFNAYHMWQLSKSGAAGGAGRPGAQAGAGSQAQGGQDESFSLDDVIEGNERATKRLPSMRVSVT